MKKITLFLVLIAIILSSCEKGGLKEEKVFKRMLTLEHNSYVILRYQNGPGRNAAADNC